MNDNRRKLTGILKLLYENTDAEHSMDTYQIMDALESMGHGRPDRKTIDANIRFIIEDLGFGIIKEKGKPNRYRWIEREFDLTELKMLVDAVHASRFIGSRKGREIIAKLKDLTSVHQAAFLNRDFHACENHKVDRTAALSIYDTVNECIKNQSRITFQMADYDIYKNEILKDEGRVYEVSPYAMMWNEGNGFMVGRLSGDMNVSAYRIDRMRNAVQQREHSEPAPADFSIEEYTDRIFDIFGGDTKEVEFSCKASAMSKLIDVFGKDFYTEKTASDQFTARVKVDVSPAFYAWVFRSCGDITITGPAAVKAEYSKMLMDQLK